MRANKLILITVIIILLVSFLAFGCRFARTTELEDRIEELERKIAKEALEEEKDEPKVEVKEIPEAEEGVVEEEEEEEEEIIYEIAFQSGYDGPFSIYSCKPDGSDIKRINERGVFEFDPCWNMEHTQIVFSSYMDGDDDLNLYIYDLTNNEVSKLTDKEGQDYSPNFSPDGKSVVFSGGIIEANDETEGELRGWEIFAVNSDGSNLKQLTDKHGFNTYPHYSPDGKTIIFTSNISGYMKLYTMDIEGNNIVQLSASGDWEDWDGTFSPDGNKAVFASDRSGNSDIWVMPVDNPDEAINLTNDPAMDMSPDWSPDGKMIVFASDRDAEENIFDIFTMKADGGNQINITPDLTDSNQNGPSW